MRTHRLPSLYQFFAFFLLMYVGTSGLRRKMAIPASKLRTGLQNTGNTWAYSSRSKVPNLEELDTPNFSRVEMAQFETHELNPLEVPAHVGLSTNKQSKREIEDSSKASTSELGEVETDRQRIQETTEENHTHIPKLYEAEPQAKVKSRSQNLDIELNKTTLLKDTWRTSEKYNLKIRKGRRILEENENHRHANVDVDFDMIRMTEVAVTECPCTDFCFAKASVGIPFGKISYCKPCYCDKQCGQRIDCCLQSLDEYEIVKNNDMVCATTKLGKLPGPLGQTWYNMVGKCLYDETVRTVSGTLYPVYSPSSDMIFINRDYANCNRVYDAIDWMTFLSSCDLRSHVPGIISGEDPNEDHRCSLNFFPPEEINVDKYICYENVVDSCNVTGQWSMYDHDMEKACATIQTPQEFEGTVYANIFCRLCNTRNHFPDLSCGITKPKSMAFTSLIDYSVILKNSHLNIRKAQDLDSKTCREFEIKDPYKSKCRQVYCQTFALRTMDGCTVFVKEWHFNGFTVHVVLTPVDDDLIPLSALAGLTRKQRQNTELWFDAGGIPVEQLTLFTTVFERNNISYAYHLDVKIGSKTGPVLAKPTMDLIMAAMSKIWKVRLDKTYKFKPSFSKFRRLNRTWATMNYATFTRNKPKPAGSLFVMFNDLNREFPGSIEITKLFFCKHVQLGHEEWTRLDTQSVILNLTSNEAAGKILGDAQYMALNTGDDETVLCICVEDFKPASSTHIVHSGSVPQRWSVTGRNQERFTVVLALLYGICMLNFLCI